MNIFLINHYAGSPNYGMEFRPYYLAREWVRKGHHVTIVGATFSHLRTRQPKSGEEYIDGVRYVWLSVPPYHGNGVGRVLNMATFVLQLFIFYRFAIGNHLPDIVIASSTYPLDIYPARFIAKKYHAKLVFEVHDIWPLTPMEIGHMSKKHPYIWAMQQAEDYVCRHVDKLVSILPKAESHYREHGLAIGKFVAVPNGIDLKEMETEQLSHDCVKAFEGIRRNYRFIVGYAGGITAYDTLQYLLESARQMRDESVGFVLVGNGTEKENLERYCRDNALLHVFFLSPVPKKEVHYLLRQMDALYIGWLETPLYRFGVSANKMFDYLLSARPVLWVGKTANNPIEEADAGISVPDVNPDAITLGIRKMMAMSEKERERMGANGRNYVIEHHNYQKLAVQFLDAVSGEGNAT